MDQHATAGADATDGAEPAAGDDPPALQQLRVVDSKTLRLVFSEPVTDNAVNQLACHPVIASSAIKVIRISDPLCGISGLIRP